MTGVRHLPDKSRRTPDRCVSCRDRTAAADPDEHAILRYAIQQPTVPCPDAATDPSYRAPLLRICGAIPPTWKANALRLPDRRGPARQAHL